MEKTIIKISGMHSVSDAAKIENILKKQPGVEISKANHESGKVVIVFDENKAKNINYKHLITSLGNFQIKETNKIKKEQEEKTESIKKLNNLQNENNSFGLYYGNTFIVGVLIGIGFMSLLLNVILLSILFTK